MAHAGGVEGDAAVGDLDPAVALGRQGKAHVLAGVEPQAVKADILAYRGGVLAAIGRTEQMRLAKRFVQPGVILLLVARLDAGLGRLDPDLQQMHPSIGGGIELTVGDAGPGAHALNLAGANHRAIAHAVAMFQFARKHAGNNLQIPVRVGAKALARLDAVLIQDPQAAKPICSGSWYWPNEKV